MTKTVRRRMTGFVVVAGVPLSFSTYWALQYSLGWGQSAPVLLLLLIYFALVLDSVSYNSTRMKQVDWEGVPSDVQDLLTSTTSKGDFVYLKLIMAFDNHDRLSQSDLHEKAKRKGVNLTLTTVREKTIDLEGIGLISTPSTVATQAKRYGLTQRGAWCQRVIKTLLPRSFFMFYLRNYLGVKRIPADPGLVPTSHASTS